MVATATIKKKMGTKATRLVSAKKSAAVSIILIETLKLLRLHERQRQYIKPTIQNIAAVASSHFSLLSPISRIPFYRKSFRANQQRPPAAISPSCTAITEIHAH